MRSDVEGKRPGNKRNENQASNKGQNAKQVRKKNKRSQTFPWKLVFGAVAIISVMALLSNPIDPNSIKNGPSAKSEQNGLNVLNLMK